MKRREFITLVGGATVAWPLVARAQPAAIPVVGFLSSRSADETGHLVAAFRDSLSRSGFTEGRSVAIEFRWADGQYDRLPVLAAELVRRPVELIVAAGGAVTALAAKAATATIPIVFLSGDDPVSFGIVPSLSRPGGNLTGVTMIHGEVGAKRLELLREVVPAAAVVAVLFNPSGPNAATDMRELHSAAHALGLKVLPLAASTERAIDAAFEALIQQRAGALFVNTDPYFASRRNQIVALAARHGVPAIYPSRDNVQAGGLMSYGTNPADAYRQLAVYAGRILKGEKPADLPILLPTKFELVINLKAAKALGLMISREVLLRADEIIE